MEKATKFKYLYLSRYIDRNILHIDVIDSILRIYLSKIFFSFSCKIGRSNIEITL